MTARRRGKKCPLLGCDRQEMERRFGASRVRCACGATGPTIMSATQRGADMAATRYWNHALRRHEKRKGAKR